MTILHRIAILISLTLISAGPLIAQNTRSQEERIARLQKEIDMINVQLKDNAARSSSALSSLALVRRKISNRRALIAESDRKIEAIDRNIKEKNKEIGVIRARMDTLTLYYERLVRSAYKNRDTRVWYMYILASDNVGQAFRRFGYLRSLSTRMNEQARKIERAREELEAETEKLMAMRKEAEAVRAQRQKDIDSLKSEESQSQTVVNQLNRDKKKYQAELRKKNQQVEALNREIREIIRKANKSSSTKTAKGGKTTSTAVDTKLSSEFAANKGKLPWPVEGTVVETFGQHYHPVFTNVKLPFNNGVTIAVKPGTEAKAVFDGTVRQVVVMPGYNQCVLIQHGKYFTFYCKLRSVKVKAGDKVAIGQSLGTVDTISSDTQLHFQLWLENTPQNPSLWLK